MRRALIAETVATAILVGIGLGAVHAAMVTGALGVPLVAACWGGAVVLLILLCGPVSGAHANPAVSLALAVLGRFPWRLVLPYCLAQLAGATLAAGLLHLIFADALAHAALASDRTCAALITQVNTEIWQHDGWWRAALAEAAGTGLILATIVVCQRRRTPPLLPPLAIGGAVALAIILFAPISQAGFNPARDLGPRLIAWLAGADPRFSPAWSLVYLLAPISGGIAAAWLAAHLDPSESSCPQSC